MRPANNPVPADQLWQNRNGSKLPEMFVERKRALDTKSLHDHETRAVGKAPPLISETEEDVRRFLDVVRRDSNNVAVPRAKLLQPVGGPIRVPAIAKEREKLVKNIVSRDEPLSIGANEGRGRLMVRVARHACREPRAGVDE
jgi:hypothetical protein